jgi:hypothetical protein
MLVGAESAEPVDEGHPLPIRRKFTADEDVRLKTLVARYGRNLWDEIAKLMADRTPRQCRDRYNNYLLDSISALPWTAEEDAILVERFRMVGPKWAEIAKSLRGRNGNHVKNRWNRHLCRFQFAQRPSRIKCIDLAPILHREPSAVQLCPLLDIDWGRVFDRLEATIGSDEMGPFGLEI